MQIVLAVVAGSVLLVGACGSQSTDRETGGGSSTTRSATTTTATIPSHSPEVVTGAAGTIAVTVAEPASRSQSAIRYVRIEDAEGQLVLEREYRSSLAELHEQLAVGQYRVVSWIRECGGPCEGKTDQDLAPPTRICGVRIEVGENATTEVTVDAPADADCTARS